MKAIFASTSSSGTESEREISRKILHGGKIYARDASPTSSLRGLRRRKEEK
jgi:hypothetical protein